MSISYQRYFVTKPDPTLCVTCDNEMISQRRSAKYVRLGYSLPRPSEEDHVAIVTPDKGYDDGLAVSAALDLLQTALRISACVRSGFGQNDAMPVRSFEDANPFHRAIRAFGVTNVGVALFPPTAHYLDQMVNKLTGGRYSFTGIAGGLPALILTATGAKSGQPT